MVAVADAGRLRRSFDSGHRAAIGAATCQVQRCRDRAEGPISCFHGHRL
ncbi:hypothetical protein roselon_02703 [Roseibacterium elongatum DSM 19469]|uniref:Uncharacterized protein n=1 Tax=Roseicyclus elongatus DSM 19469 TaxID=1294273 RepID=W8S493_9RHOB|nr:hypothetical protein roselon_02703 [Roseibacterium elongatum DSM 19469]